MGCTSSKNATVDFYRPPPSSFAVFDLNSIQEPWLSGDNPGQENQEKPTNLPAPILEKLNKLESDTPHSWDEVSKALEDLKTPPAPPPSAVVSAVPEKKKGPVKSQSFHTLEELDAKVTKPQLQNGMKKTQSLKSITEPPPYVVAPAKDTGEVIKPLKENIFLMRDRLEREKEGKMVYYEKKKVDPLSQYPDRCPPGGADSVVVYTTSLRGVRRTYEDCNRVKEALEGQRVVFDERDVSLHAKFRNELRTILEEEVSLPRLFVKGKYIGGVEEVSELDESGRLGRILSWARVEKGVGRQACEGCGGARFVPCLDCGGSCKVVIDGVKDRCGKCNENGLILCPMCL
ncbi:Glutaredoxin family protein [Euphorbia peplus]|nr:Glutaredoxin family protein [Euphorbia peplus]